MQGSSSRRLRFGSLVALGLLAACAPSVPLNTPAPVQVIEPPSAVPARPEAAASAVLPPAAADASPPEAAQAFPVGPAAGAPAPDAAASAPAGPASAASTAAALGPAVEARFPPPAVRYDTPGLQPGRQTFTTQSELREAMRALADRAGSAASVRLLALGTSAQGVPLEALLLSRVSGALDPAALAASGRPNVLLIGGQHGDEPAGTEALLVVARQLAQGRLAPLLDKLNVLVVPRANPDAALYEQRSAPGAPDVNRDHLLLKSAEARALVKLAREYAPALVVDAHEYPAAAPWLAKFDAVPAQDALLQYATTPNLEPFLTRAAEEWFRRPLVEALQRERLASDWYYTTSDDPADKSLAMGGPGADTARNASGLRNAIGFLVESRGIGLGHAQAERRVHAQVTAISSLLASAAARAGDLAKLRGYVEATVSSQACQGEAVVQALPTRSEHRVLMLDPASGADKPLTVDWDSALTLVPRLSRPRPCGYWLAASAGEAVAKLREQGVQVQQLAENATVQGDTYREVPRPANAPAALPAPYELVAALLDMPAGSYYVPLTQPLANLVIAALEPDAPTGFVAGGVLGAGDRIARVRVPPEAKFVAVQP